MFDMHKLENAEGKTVFLNVEKKKGHLGLTPRFSNISELCACSTLLNVEKKKSPWLTKLNRMNMVQVIGRSLATNSAKFLGTK